MEIVDVSYEDLFEFPQIDDTTVQIDCSHNKISSTSGLQDLLLLKSLDISYNFIDQIQGWVFLSNLTVLNMSHNKLVSIQGLHSCYKLTTIQLQNNQLKSISGLETLKSLQYLNLSNNLISEKAAIRPLSLNSKLEVLYLEENLITGYRQLCYSMILSLVMLDGLPTPGRPKKGTVKDSYRLKKLS